MLVPMTSLERPRLTRDAKGFGSSTAYRSGSCQSSTSVRYAIGDADRIPALAAAFTTYRHATTRLFDVLFPLSQTCLKTRFN